MYEPEVPRVVAFFDGQNLFHAVREAFGYTYPNYDPRALALRLCSARGWKLVQTRFYTGVPDLADNPFWHKFWAKKLLHMRRQSVAVYSRSIRYVRKEISCPSGETHSVVVGDEKGVDVRMAIDIISMAYKNKLDVALIFSQDQDMTEVAMEIRAIAQDQRRWIKIASAYPAAPERRGNRGVDRTDWISFDKMIYDECLDSTDYRAEINASEAEPGLAIGPAIGSEPGPETSPAPDPDTDAED
jgi:uncharacterized LabA/DUF88 family protein